MENYYLFDFNDNAENDFSRHHLKSLEDEILVKINIFY